MFYVAYDPASNIVITRYDTEIAPLPDPLPSGTAVIEVPDQATMLSTTAPGWTVQNGVLVAPPPPSAAELLAQAQYENSSQYTVDASTTPPTIQQAPASVLLTQAQARQLSLLQSSFSQAEQAPVSFTNAAGVAGTFLMTPHAWTKYLGEWTEYVILKSPLPNNSGTTATFYTATGTAVEFTLADIENFYKAGKTQIKSAEANLSAKISAVKAATTVSEVHAIVW